MVISDYTLNRIKKIDILLTFPDIIGGITNVIENPISSALDLAKNMDTSFLYRENAFVACLGNKFSKRINFEVDVNLTIPRSLLRGNLIPLPLVGEGRVRGSDPVVLFR
jgi:hypothetical protein